MMPMKVSLRLKKININSHLGYMFKKFELIDLMS